MDDLSAVMPDKESRRIRLRALQISKEGAADLLKPSPIAQQIRGIHHRPTRSIHPCINGVEVSLPYHQLDSDSSCSMMWSFRMTGERNDLARSIHDAGSDHSIPSAAVSQTTAKCTRLGPRHAAAP